MAGRTTSVWVMASMKPGSGFSWNSPLGISFAVAAGIFAVVWLLITASSAEDSSSSDSLPDSSAILLAPPPLFALVLPPM